MLRPGSNLPGFRAVQLDFAAHIRNPEKHRVPADVDPRRMRVYAELFYNNIEGFISSAFPVARSLFADADWHGLVRAFVETHPSASPYFLEISQEFLTFLADSPPPELAPYLLELCHYEWVELALSVSEQEMPEQGFDADGDLASGVVLVSPLVWPLTYQYPVHKIGREHRPAGPAEGSTHLVVYRTRELAVRFLESNSVTHRLLALLDGHRTGQEALSLLGLELPHHNGDRIHALGMDTLEKLRRRQIVLGTRTAD
jgi:hypothetical protein